MRKVIIIFLFICFYSGLRSQEVKDLQAISNFIVEMYIIKNNENIYKLVAETQPMAPYFQYIDWNYFRGSLGKAKG